MPSVLVLDESSRVRGLIADALSGCAVVCARDCREALSLMAHARFDAIVVEVILAEGDAFSAISAIREGWPHCLVVAISGGGRFVSAAQALDVARVLGAHVRLAKPFSRDELRAALAPALPPIPTRSLVQ